MLPAAKLAGLPRLDRDTDEEIAIRERRWCWSARDGPATRVRPLYLVARNVGIAEHHQPAGLGRPDVNCRAVEGLRRDVVFEGLASHLASPLLIGRGRRRGWPAD